MMYEKVRSICTLFFQAFLLLFLLQVLLAEQRLDTTGSTEIVLWQYTMANASANSQPTVGQLSVNYQSTVGRLLANVLMGSDSLPLPNE